MSRSLNSIFFAYKKQFVCTFLHYLGVIDDIFKSSYPITYKIKCEFMPFFVKNAKKCNK